eukprot:Seg2340.11 transcript_id=Seg2340.11/GoldUCD/mRNA.D3Y31 product="hypothetical protein" protein_id=Seg2340.11/GoldUCD/D3Y31
MPKENEEEQELDELKDSEPDTAFNIEVLPEETVPPKYDRSLSGRIKGSIRKIFRGKEDLTSPEEHQEDDDEEEISDIKPLCLEPIDVGDSESDGEEDRTELAQINVTIKLSEVNEDVVVEEVDTGVVETVDVDMSQFDPSDNETSDIDNNDEEESEKLAVKDEEPVTFDTFSAEVVPKRVVYRQTIMPKENEEEQELDELKDSEPDTAFKIEVLPEETVPPKYDRSLSGRIKGSIRKIFRSKEDLTLSEEPFEEGIGDEISDIQPLCLEPINIGDSESEEEPQPIDTIRVNVTIKNIPIDEDFVVEEVDTAVVETVDIDMSQFESSESETSDAENSEEGDDDKLAINDEESVTFETFSTEVVPKGVVYREPKLDKGEKELYELKEAEPMVPFNIVVLDEEHVPPKYDQSLPGRIKGSILQIFRSKEDLTTSDELPEHDTGEEVCDIQPLHLEPVDFTHSEDSMDCETGPFKSVQVDIAVSPVPFDDDIITEEVETGVVETVEFDFDLMSDDKPEADAIVTDIHPTCSDNSSSESSEEEEEPTQDQETAPVHDISDNQEQEEPEADEIPQEEERRVTAVYRIKDKVHDDEDLKGLMDSHPSEPVFHKPNKEQLSKPVGRYHPKRMRSTIIGFFDMSPKNDKRHEPDSPELETGSYEVMPLCLEPMDTDRVSDEPEEFEAAPVAAVCDRDGTVFDEEPITEVHDVSPPENEIDFDVMFESDESSDEADSQEGNPPEIDQNFILEIQEEDLDPDVHFDAAPMGAEIDEGIVEEKDELEEPEATYEVESVPVNILESIKEAPEEEEEMKYVIDVKPYDIEQLQIPEIVIDLAEDDADSASSSPDSDSEIQGDEEVKNEINEPDETEEPRYFIEYSMAGIKAESDQLEKEESDLEGSTADFLPVSKDEQPDDGTSSSSSESYQSEKAEEPEDIAADVLSAAQEEDLHDDISPSSSESEHSENQEETDLHILAAPISEEDVHSDTASSSSEQSHHDEIAIGDFDEPAKHELETPPAEEPVKFEVDIINFEMPLVVEIREHSIETNEDKEICSSAQSDDEDLDQVPVVEEEISLPVADNDVESAVLCEDVQEDDDNRSESLESITEIEECLPNSVEEIEFELVESSYSVNPENVIIEEDKQTREELDTIEEAVVAAVEISPVEEAKVYVVETVARDLVEEQIYPAEVEDTEAQKLPVDEEDSHSESDNEKTTTVNKENDVENSMGLYIDNSIDTFVDSISYGNVKEAAGEVCITLKSMEDEKKPRDMTVEEYLKSMGDEKKPREMTVEEYLKSMEDEKKSREMTVEEYLKSMEDEKKPREMTVEEYLKSMEDEKKPREMTVEEYLKSMEDEKKPREMTVEEYLKSMEDEKKPRDMTVEEYLKSMEDEKKPRDMTVEEYLKSMEDEKKPREMTVEEYLKSMENEKKPREMTVEEYLKSLEDDKKPREMTVEEYLKSMENEKKPREMTVEEYLKLMEDEKKPREMTVEEYLKSIEDEKKPREMTVEEYLKSMEEEKKPCEMTVEEYLKSMEDKKKPREMTVEEYLKSLEGEKRPCDMTVEEYLKSMEDEKKPREMTVEEYLKSMEDEKKPCEMTVEEYLKSMEDEKKPREMTVEEYLKSLEGEKRPCDMTVEEYLKSMEDEKKSCDMTVEEYLKSMEDEKKPHEMTVEEYLRSMEDEKKPHEMTVEEYLKSMEDEKKPCDMTVEEYLKSMEDEKKPHEMTVEEYLKSMEDEKKPRDMTVEEYLKSMEDEKKPREMTVEEYLKSMEDEKKPRDMTVEEYLKSVEDEKKPCEMTVEEYLKSMEDEKKPREITVEEYLKSLEGEKRPCDMTVEEYLKSMEDEKKSCDMTVEEYLKSMEDEKKPREMTVEEYLKSMEDEKKPRDMTVEEYLKSMEDEKKPCDMTVEEYLKSMEDEKKPREMTVEEYLKSMEDEKKPRDMTVEEYLKSMEDEKKPHEMTVEEYLKSMEDEKKPHEMTVEEYLKSMADEEKPRDMTVEEYLKSMEDEEKPHEMTVEEYLKSMKNEKSISPYNNVSVHYFGDEDQVAEFTRVNKIYDDSTDATMKVLCRLLSVECRNVSLAYEGLDHDQSFSDLGREFRVAEALPYKLESLTVDESDCLPQCKETDKSPTNIFEDPYTNEDLQNIVIEDLKLEEMRFDENAPSLFDFESEWRVCGLPQGRPPVNERCKQTLIDEIKPEFKIDDNDLDDLKDLNLDTFALYQTDNISNEKVLRKPRNVDSKRGFIGPSSGEVDDERHIHIGSLVLEELKVEDCSFEESSRPDYIPMDDVQHDIEEEQSQYLVDDIMFEDIMFEIPEYFPIPDKELASNNFQDDLITYSESTHPTFHHTQMRVNKIGSVLPEPCVSVQYFDVSLLPHVLMYDIAVPDKREAARAFSRKFDQQSSNFDTSDTWKVLHFCAVSVLFAKIQRSEKIGEVPGKKIQKKAKRSRSRHSRDVPRVVRKRQKPPTVNGHDADVSGTESFTESETGSSFAITGSPFTSPRSSFRGKKWDPRTSRYELPSESEDGSTFAVTGSLKSLDEDSQLSDVDTIGDSDAGSLFAVTGSRNNLDRELSESDTVIESEDGSTFAVTGNRKRLDSDGSSFVLTGSPKKFKGSSQSSSNVDLSEEDRRDGECSRSKSEVESAFAVTGRRSVDSLTSEDDVVDGAKLKRSNGVTKRKEKLATFV